MGDPVGPHYAASSINQKRKQYEEASSLGRHSIKELLWGSIKIKRVESNFTSTKFKRVSVYLTNGYTLTRLNFVLVQRTSMLNFSDCADRPIKTILPLARLVLDFPIMTVDFKGMNFENSELIEDHPLCLTILQVYADNVRLQKEDKEHKESKWQDRVSAVVSPTEEDSSESEAWSEAHGLLIAYGLLDIEIAGREDGIQYRMTTDGERLLKMYEQYQQMIQEQSDISKVA